jgi:hypothetical protein
MNPRARALPWTESSPSEWGRREGTAGERKQQDRGGRRDFRWGAARGSARTPDGEDRWGSQGRARWQWQMTAAARSVGARERLWEQEGKRLRWKSVGPGETLFNPR